MINLSFPEQNTLKLNFNSPYEISQDDIDDCEEEEEEARRKFSLPNKFLRKRRSLDND